MTFRIRAGSEQKLVEMIGATRHWFAGHADMAVIDEDPDSKRLKVAVVGREPNHPLLGVVWLNEWPFRAPLF
jgi:hypothetical protein